MKRDQRIHSSKDHRIVCGHCIYSCETQNNKYIVCEIDGSTHSKLNFNPCKDFNELFTRHEYYTNWRRK